MAYMNVHGERVLITDETIVKTWLECADNAQGCIDEILDGSEYCNPDFKDTYIEQQKELKKLYTKNANSIVKPSGLELWFWQKAYYIQSGESVGILS